MVQLEGFCHDQHLIYKETLICLEKGVFSHNFIIIHIDKQYNESIMRSKVPHGNQICTVNIWTHHTLIFMTGMKGSELLQHSCQTLDSKHCYRTLDQTHLLT